METATVGLVCAVLSALFNGSFAALFKTKKMVELDVHPMVFQLHCCCGIFISSWFVLPFLLKNPVLLHDESVGDTFALSGYGIVAGFLFVLAVSGSFNAVHDIGLALAQGIWGGGAMVVAYLWGLLVFDQVPAHLGLSFLGLLLLVVGVLGIALSDKIAKTLMQGRTTNEESLSLMPPRGDDSTNEGYEAVCISSEKNTSNVGSNKKYLRGVLWACSVGVSGGSILAPLNYVNPQKQGLVFLPSFGIGTMILSPLAFHTYVYLTGTSPPPLHVRQALITGLLSGLVWNIGNLLSIVAIPAIGYGVAYPMMQCAILVSGMWGIYCFQEITDLSTISIFWLSGFILILGGGILTAAQ